MRLHTAGGGISGFVCVDSDGQHSIEDIVRCAEQLSKDPQALVLGCRNFDGKDIPARSRFGNKVTKNVLKVMCGIAVKDTQTGLRALSAETAKLYIQTAGERYEYEMNMLVETKEKQIPVVEVPIKTIYINDNESSHFNPIVDSWKIYKVFLKFLFSGLSSFVIDIGLFSIFIHILRPWKYYIIISTIIARAVSSAYNYLLNKNHVFQSKTGKSTIFRYYTLAFCQMAVSAIGVNYIVSLFDGFEIPIKLLTDTALFALSFYFQREWVFKN